jgi:hypothetical protein
MVAYVFRVRVQGSGTGPFRCGENWTWHTSSYLGVCPSLFCLAFCSVGCQLGQQIGTVSSYPSRENGRMQQQQQSATASPPSSRHSISVKPHPRAHHSDQQCIRGLPTTPLALGSVGNRGVMSHGFGSDTRRSYIQVSKIQNTTRRHNGFRMFACNLNSIPSVVPMLLC